VSDVESARQFPENHVRYASAADAYPYETTSVLAALWLTPGTH